MYSDVCGCRLVGGDSGGRGGECTVTVCGCRLVGGDSGGRGGECTVTRVDVGW